MDEMERMRRRYGPEVASSYPKTGPDRPGYKEYAAAIAEGCIGNQLRILDLGCGTGRYFHCLRNVSVLVGIDISIEMLKVAESVKRELESLANTQTILLETDFTSIQFVPNSFEFIFCIGVVGELIPLKQKLVENLIEWLSPGGRAFLTVVDKLAYQQEKLDQPFNIKELIRKLIANSPLPSFMGTRLASKFLFSYDSSRNYMVREKLERMLKGLSNHVLFEIVQFRDAKNPKLGIKLVKKPL